MFREEVILGIVSLCVVIFLGWMEIWICCGC